MSKVWLVTGSSHGLGRAVAEQVLANGDMLVAVSPRPQELENLRFNYGEKVHTAGLDTGNTGQACDAVRVALDAFGRLDVLVNTTGHGAIASIEETAEEEFHDQLVTNLLGVINMTRAALPLMRVQRSGHIMQIASVCGRIGCPGLGAYQAAQWGVEGFSEALSREVAPFGVRVTIIEPGLLPAGPGGSSLRVAKPGSDYAASIGTFLDGIRTFDTTAAGTTDGGRAADLQTVARTIIRIADEPEPPLRLLIGGDAYQLALEKDVEKLAETQKWKELSMSADITPLRFQSVMRMAIGSMSR